VSVGAQRAVDMIDVITNSEPPCDDLRHSRTGPQVAFEPTAPRSSIPSNCDARWCTLSFYGRLHTARAAQPAHPMLAVCRGLAPNAASIGPGQVRHFNRRVSFFEQRDCPLALPLQLLSTSLPGRIL
jgi:hypothetical protein